MELDKSKPALPCFMLKSDFESSFLDCCYAVFITIIVIIAIIIIMIDIAY